MGQNNSRDEDEDDNREPGPLRPGPQPAALPSDPLDFGTSPGSLTDQVRRMINSEEADEYRNANQKHTVRTVFTWSGGGNTCFIQGSFNQWRAAPMTRSESGAHFTAVYDLLPGTHLFQYLVDDKWLCDENLPIVTDEKGIANNSVVIQLPTHNKSFSITHHEGENDADSEEMAESDDEFGIDNNVQYGRELIPHEEFAKDPPSIPPHFGEVLLNHSIHTVDPYELPLPQHVTLNHVYLKNPRASVDTVVLGMTKRFKTKFVTTVYYKPKN